MIFLVSKSTMIGRIHLLFVGKGDPIHHLRLLSELMTVLKIPTLRHLNQNILLARSRLGVLILAT